MMSLQTRLTLAFLLLAAPVLALFGTSVFLVSRNRLLDSVDENLVHRGTMVQSAILVREGPLSQEHIEASRRSLDRLAVDGAAFEVLDRDARLLYSSNGIASDLGLPQDPSHRRYATAVFGDERLRVLTIPLISIGELLGYVQVSSSLEVADSSLAIILRVLLVGGVIVLLATALPAHVLVGRALDPVRRVSRLARELEKTGDFSRRLVNARTTSEMQELTTAFNRMVERVEKMMQAQRAFLADSSHELRRPLTILRTNIDVINDPGLSDSERRLVESEMRSEAESMSRLVADLVLLSRDGQASFDLKASNLSELCIRAVEGARFSFPMQRFVCEIACDVWALLDEERFSQALANLLQNAAAYSPAEGIILTSLTDLGGAAELDVTDFGYGMSRADAEHAFDRFYRGASSRDLRTEGFGLGLAIVKHVVEAHAGEVYLHSRLGQGTRVTIRLPLRERGVVIESDEVSVATGAS